MGFVQHKAYKELMSKKMIILNHAEFSKKDVIGNGSAIVLQPVFGHDFGHVPAYKMV